MSGLFTSAWNLTPSQLGFEQKYLPSSESGRWRNSTLSTHSLSASFTNQVMAQIELWDNHNNYENKVYVLPKHLDEKVARLHLDKVGAKLTPLSKEQADYISVTPEGPYKPHAYRY